MALKTGEEYVKSIKKLNLKAQVMGKEVTDLPEHPLVAPSLRAVAATFDCAFDEGSRDLFRVRSSLTGEEVNRFLHLHQSTQDLMNKVIMQRHCGNVTSCCFQRCVGMDAANALFSVTYECDKAHGTDYHRRFREFWAHVQSEDLVVDGAMTDPKGDRGKRPAHMSGPWYLTPLLGPDVTVFDSALFYPYDCDELQRGHETFSTAYAVHHWANQRRLRKKPL